MRASMRCPAILVDRDGTIIVERDYLDDPDGVVLEQGAVDGLARLASAGFALVIVTNQSGIARGYFDRSAADAVNQRVVELLAREGVPIAGIYLCPHGPGEACSCRKPAPGMAIDAAADLDLDLTRSWVIGDKRSDVELAAAVGARSILVLTGHGECDHAWANSDAVSIAATLADAADLILAADAAAQEE